MLALMLKPVLSSALQKEQRVRVLLALSFVIIAIFFFVVEEAARRGRDRSSTASRGIDLPGCSCSCSGTASGCSGGRRLSHSVLLVRGSRGLLGRPRRARVGSSRPLALVAVVAVVSVVLIVTVSVAAILVVVLFLVVIIVVVIIVVVVVVVVIATRKAEKPIIVADGDLVASPKPALLVLVPTRRGETRLAGAKGKTLRGQRLPSDRSESNDADAAAVHVTTGLRAELDFASQKTIRGVALVALLLSFPTACTG